jgi:hypothetical protein
VSRVSDSHGLCYEVELGRHDFDRERRVWVNPDELAGERRAADITAEEVEALSLARDCVSARLQSYAAEHFSDGHVDLHQHALAILDRLTTNGGKP